MTPVLKALKRAWERHIGTWAEGADPPARFRKVVELFAQANPRATVADWVEFAAKSAEGAYQDGYRRGFERGERLGPEWEDPDAAAAVYARLDSIAEGNGEPYDPSAVVPIDGVPQEYAARTALAMNDLLLARGQRRGPRR